VQQERGKTACVANRFDGGGLLVGERGERRRRRGCGCQGRQDCGGIDKLKCNPAFGLPCGERRDGFWVQRAGVGGREKVVGGERLRETS